jgi:glucose-1-phosphate thymidylyltransferase
VTTTSAVVLAAGLGTRMRTADSGAPLTEEQRRAADAGMKAMMPIGGRPFLDYVLSAAADAGLRRVGIVVAPDHAALRRYYDVTAPPSRITLDFLVQQEPRGTADAVLAAEAWAGGGPFLVMNADNLYPVPALRELAGLDEPGLPGFDRDDLVRTGNIEPARLGAFALVDVDDRGYLRRIVEKPGPEYARSHALISMNVWRFDTRIFDACRRVPRSPRGEYELPLAVGFAAGQGVRFRVLPAAGPVLDLSQRADAAEVARRLARVAPNP